MNELKIQHEYVMEFLCHLEEQGGLGLWGTERSV